MISPIDNLKVMFFKWGMDMLSNITLPNNTKYMKFKMLYDRYKRTKPLILTNQPTIPNYPYEQRMKLIKYNKNDEEDTNEVVKLFRSMIIKHFDKNEFKKREDEVIKGFQSLTMQHEV
jgi:hypothetical protein